MDAPSWCASDNRGHYNVEGRVDGRRMDFVVDTGATIIAIPAREAARLGIHPARRDYTAQIRTANGTIRAAPTQLGPGRGRWAHGA